MPVTVQVTLSTSDSSDRIARQGLLFRYTDSNHYLYWYFITNSQLRCYKYDSGNPALLFAVAANALDGDVLSVVLEDDEIELRHNGSLLTTIMESYNQSATKHGLYWEVSGFYGHGHHRWDDFSISPDISDTFTRADSSTLGLSTSGHTWLTNPLVTGEYGIAGNKAKVVTTANHALAWIDDAAVVVPAPPGFRHDCNSINMEVA